MFTPSGKTAFVIGVAIGHGRTVTPVSTATGTPGEPIKIAAPNIDVLIPGDETPQ